MKQQSYKRKHFFINKRLQGKFTVYFLVLGLFITVGTSVLIWYLSQEEFESFVYRTHLSVTSPWKVIFPVLLKALAASTILLIVSTFILTRIIFKRLGTKLKTFDAALLEVGKGNLGVVPPADGLDELNEPLRNFTGKLKSDVEALRKIHGDISKAAGTADAAALNETFRKKLLEWEFKAD